MTAQRYKVELAVGTGVNYHEWDIEQGDAAAYGPMGGLQIVESILPDGLWPPGNAPAECRLQVIAPTATTYPHIRLGAVLHVIVRVGSTYQYRVAEFHGRISENVVEPHALGVVHTIQAVDFTADLREPFTIPRQENAAGAVVGTTWPSETSYNRFDRVVQLLGYDPVGSIAINNTPGGIFEPGDPWAGEGLRLAGPGNGSKPVVVDGYDYIQGILRQWPQTYPDYPIGGTARPYLVPVQANGPFRPPSSWTIKPRFENPPSPTAAQPIPASAVDFSSRWSETREANVNKVIVRYTFPGDEGSSEASASLGIKPPTVRVIDGDVSFFTEQQLLADLYLPASSESLSWIADTFTYYGSLDLPGSPPTGLGEVVTVTGIPAHLNPTGLTWYSGQVAARTLTVAGQQITQQINLRRPDFTDPSEA